MIRVDFVQIEHDTVNHLYVISMSGAGFGPSSSPNNIGASDGGSVNIQDVTNNNTLYVTPIWWFESFIKVSVYDITNPLGASSGDSLDIRITENMPPLHHSVTVP